MCIRSKRRRKALVYLLLILALVVVFLLGRRVWISASRAIEARRLEAEIERSPTSEAMQRLIHLETSRHRFDRIDVLERKALELFPHDLDIARELAWARTVQLWRASYGLLDRIRYDLSDLTSGRISEPRSLQTAERQTALAKAKVAADHWLAEIKERGDTHQRVEDLKQLAVLYELLGDEETALGCRNRFSREE